MSLDKKYDSSIIDVAQVGSIEDHVIASGYKDFNDKLDIAKYGETKRKLSSRHVSLMIIGQSIGSGLFIGLSSPLMTSGSLSLLTGFIFWAVLVIWVLMQCIGEMCSYLPIKGSFLHFSARFVDPALGFAVTLIYLYASCMFICLEATAFSSTVKFWTGDKYNPGIFITVCLVCYFFFNIYGVNWYGEIEFFSSMLKVLLIVGLMLFALISMCGGNPQHNAYGFQHWKEGGLARAYLVKGSTGKFLGWWNVLIYAAFSCGGPDLLALVSGEMRNPRKNVALASRRAYIRIYLFYFGGIFFMNTLCSSINPTLLAAAVNGSVGAAASPWVIGIKEVGVHGLDSLVNALIMSSVFSCGNAFFYGSTRTAYSAALAGYLPRVFSRCLKNGCPIYCVVLTSLISCLAFLSISNSTAVVFNWFINLATTGLLCAYICMWLSYFKFRRGLKAQGIDINSDSYPYFRATKFIMPLAYFGFFINVIVLIFNGFWIFFPGQFNVANLFTSYFAPVFFICLYVFWKVLKRTKIRTDDEVDLTTGKQEIDDEEVIELEYESNHVRKTGIVFKIWYAIADFCFN
ncbi:proline-specific permease [Scheffersomyces coipomensis]|uniref:proline-specific permease n=1 Tax=Scheffersomyces coipomensis TaxID=1788519 RepID=UPI00315DE50B